MIQLYWPGSPGEWLGFGSASVTVLLGLALLVLPRLTLRLLGAGSPGQPSAARAAGGFIAGLGLACLAMAQPFLYFGIGAAWILAAFGRLLAAVFDGARGPRDWLFLILAAALGAMPLAFVLGYVG